MSERPHLPTPWNLYNLQSSPYFQDALMAADQTPRPLTSLFVGRGEELGELKIKIHGSGGLGTRQAIAGPPGVGKTTLVQEIKAELQDDGFLTTDSLIAVLPNDTSESLFGRVIGAVYDTILANRPGAVNSNAMQDAQLLVRATRLSSGSAGLSVYGFGATAGKSTNAVVPPDIMIDGPRVLRDLMKLVGTSDAHGLVLHVNNLETLSEANAAAAADIFRALRDIMLMHDGLHVLIVGTNDAVNTIVNTHAQVRNIFSILTLEPLDVSDVHKLLEARYKYLQLDEERSVVSPVAMDAVESLYTLYRGDLRGTLKALEDGAAPLLGIVGTGPSKAGAHVRPLTMEEIRSMLRQRYSVELESFCEAARVQQLTAWGSVAADNAMTQEALTKLWNISQPAVSTALRYFIQLGYIRTTPRERGQATQYVLSGTAKLIFSS